MYTLGIIGNGFVGKATFQLQCNEINIIAYDLNPELCMPKHTTFNDILKCDIVFICVPTPMKNNGECYLVIVESVVQKLHENNYEGHIVLRSTVPVGTSNSLQCFFMPEFLTEANFIEDFKQNKNWIFGLSDNQEKNKTFKTLIQNIITTAYTHNKIYVNKCSFVDSTEAEAIKLFRNCFLATKVSFCNEFYTFCDKKNINYNTIVDIAAEDDRIGKSHTRVPGPDKKFGFGGTCFPKDMNNLWYQMNQIEGCEPKVIEACIQRNNTIDRPVQDWNKNKGRAVIDK